MTTNDLYVRMCKEHPIQGEWKERVDLLYSDTYGYSVDVYTQNTYIRPRQEDWQEKYLQSRNKEVIPKDRKFKCMLEDFIVAVYNQKYEELHDLSIMCGDMTILWCLFVSKEVYGLSWDWDKDEWRKA